MGNYAFLDIAQEFQLEIVSKFLNKTKAKLSYINTAVAGNFHGDILVCEKWVNSLKTIFPEGEFNTLDDFLYPKLLKNRICKNWFVCKAPSWILK